MHSPGRPRVALFYQPRWFGAQAAPCIPGRAVGARTEQRLEGNTHSRRKPRSRGPSAHHGDCDSTPIPEHPSRPPLAPPEH